jgi:Meiotically up-regulated gene 113
VSTSVYFAQGGPFLKIGFSRNPEKRIANLGYTLSRPKDTGPLTLIATLPGSRTLESLAHKLFGVFRIGGEWFEANSQSLELIDHLSSVAKQLARGGIVKEGALLNEWGRVLGNESGISRPSGSRWIRISNSPIGSALTRKGLETGEVIGAALLKNETGQILISVVDTVSLDSFIERLVLSEIRKEQAKAKETTQ